MNPQYQYGPPEGAYPQLPGGYPGPQGGPPQGFQQGPPPQGYPGPAAPVRPPQNGPQTGGPYGGPLKPMGGYSAAPPPSLHNGTMPPPQISPSPQMGGGFPPPPRLQQHPGPPHQPPPGPLHQPGFPQHQGTPAPNASGSNFQLNSMMDNMHIGGAPRPPSAFQGQGDMVSPHDGHPPGIPPQGRPQGPPMMQHQRPQLHLPPGQHPPPLGQQPTPQGQPGFQPLRPGMPPPQSSQTPLQDPNRPTPPPGYYDQPPSQNVPPAGPPGSFPPGPRGSIMSTGQPVPGQHPMGGYGAPPLPGGPINDMQGGGSIMNGAMSGPPSQPMYQQGGIPGQDSMQSNYPGGMRPGQMAPAPTPAQQQSRRLDPDQMPSPIQVMEDDRKSKVGNFVTNTKGTVPPLVTTDFICQDQGNCNPRFIRSSMYSIPSTPDMIKQSHVPFSITITPFATLKEGEFLPPVAFTSDIGPVRCVRCKAYMSPFMQFIDGGRRFQCNLCKATTEVPPEYFVHLDHTGLRVDKFERPELCLGSYEFVATKDYCRNNTFPKPPAFIFALDVSYNNVKNGLVSLFCENIKDILSSLPREGNDEHSKIRLGFITYNNSVHFYNLKPCLAQPQVMIVSDVQDMFVPLLDGFLVTLEESSQLIDSLMEQIPAMFADTRETETVLGPAIQAGLDALKAADCTGKVFLFHSSLPIAEAPGKLKNRDDRKVLGTDKEKTVLQPQINFYNQLGQDCVAAGCSVDLYAFPNAYLDLATIGQVCRLTGGQLYKYNYFQAELDGSRFLEDLSRNIQRPIAFDAIMRVRTSAGVRPTDFYGCFYMSNTTDVELASVDSDKAITVEIKHDDKLTEDDSVHIQAAILYTSVGGQRRLRVHNIALNTCTQLAELFRNCELDTIVNFMAKQAIRQLCDQPPKTVKDNLVARCAQVLACYRRHCAQASSAGQLILPEAMKLLPLYMNCVIKSDAVSGGSDMMVDDRSFAMQAVCSMDVGASVAYFYPRLIPLHDIDWQAPSNTLPTAVRCTAEKLAENGAYLLENSLYMFVWIGLNVNPEWVQGVFGVQSIAQVDVEKTSLLDLDNPISQKVRGVIRQVQKERQRSMRLYIVRQRDKLDIMFRHFLVEDKGADGSPSYVDFLCHVHKEIRNLLN